MFYLMTSTTSFHLSHDRILVKILVPVSLFTTKSRDFRKNFVEEAEAR